MLDCTQGNGEAVIIETFEQLSTEWFAARVGRPSASQFDKIITTKGEPSKQRQKYLYQLAGERISGTREETYCNAAMQRGTEMEPEARALYELMRDVSVDQVGMCYRDSDKLFSCSPDGLVGEDGGLEIKCPSMAVHVEYLMGGKLPTDYFQQVHGSLLVTGRKWWDFLSYYPGIKPLLVRVFPDKGFMGVLDLELAFFCEELSAIVDQIKEAA